MDEYTTTNAALSIFSKNYMELKSGLPIRPNLILSVLLAPGTHLIQNRDQRFSALR